MMNLPQQVLWALDRLGAAGYEAWLAGGCVRDALMGVPPHDYDLATSAQPEEMAQAFSDQRVIETGLAHGTLTVLREGMPLEITTYRGNGLEEDLRRRDLTVNAMAFHPARGLLDPFGGQQDLSSGVLRAVDDPDARYQEDALRVLRTLRFASVLGFAIDPRTLAAMERAAPALAGVSAERIAAEMVKLLCGAHVCRVLVEHIDLLGAVVPEALPMKGFDQRNHHHIYDILTHTAHSVAAIQPVPALRLAMFFHDMGKPGCFALGEDGEGHFHGHAAVSADISHQVLSRWKMDNFTRERVTELVRLHDRQIEPTAASVRRALSRLTPEVFNQLLLVKRADNLAQAPQYRCRQQYYDQLEQIRDEAFAASECFSLRDLALKGRDVLALGVKPGPDVGAILRALLDAVLGGECENTREALTALARKMI